MTYLLHCLPGSIASKGIVFHHLKPLLNEGGTIFGATLLSGGVERSWTARRLMAFYNARGIFTNDQDDREGLEHALSNHLTEPRVQVVGCAALFVGRVSRSHRSRSQV